MSLSVPCPLSAIVMAVSVLCKPELRTADYRKFTAIHCTVPSHSGKLDEVITWGWSCYKKRKEKQQNQLQLMQTMQTIAAQEQVLSARLE